MIDFDIDFNFPLFSLCVSNWDACAAVLSLNDINFSDFLKQFIYFDFDDTDICPYILDVTSILTREHLIVERHSSPNSIICYVYYPN